MLDHALERCCHVTKRVNHIVLTEFNVRIPKTRHVPNELNFVRIDVQVRILMIWNVPHAEVWSGIVISAGHNLFAISALACFPCNTLGKLNLYQENLLN